MQSDIGIASRAIAALAGGDEAEAYIYYGELVQRYPAFSGEPGRLIREAGGWRDALVKCIVCCSFGRAKEINRLLRRLLTLTDWATAEQLLLASFVERAKQESHPDRIQRLYKVACRYLNKVLATEVFKQNGVPITVPHSVEMMLSSDSRHRELQERIRPSQLVVR